MSKTIGGTILTFAIVVILFLTLGTTPDETVTSPTSAVNSAKQGLATDTVIDAGGQAIKQTGELAINSACKDGSSQGCSVATNTVTMTGIAFTIMVYGIIVAGIIGVAKFALSFIQSFT